MIEIKSQGINMNLKPETEAFFTGSGVRKFFFTLRIDS